jgi:hypothetical protein
VLPEPLRALTLTAALLLMAAPAGAAALRLMGTPQGAFGPRIERLALSLALGLGLHAVGLTLLGLAGMLHPLAVLALPAALALLGGAWLGWRRAPAACPAPGQEHGQEHEWDCAIAPGRPVRGARAVPMLAAALACGIAACVLVAGLAPPTDYDGLLYHLVAPRAYLQAACRPGASSTCRTTSRRTCLRSARCCSPSRWRVPRTGRRS